MQKEDTNVNVGSVMGRLARLVRLASKWAWREELGRYQNVTEDAQSLVDALMRGEPANAYCGYGRYGQASNYRDELKCSLRDLKSNDEELVAPASYVRPSTRGELHDKLEQGIECEVENSA